jgi:hypothetical protein
MCLKRPKTHHAVEDLCLYVHAFLPL